MMTNLNIPNTYKYVKNPDHPFVYLGPDYLISNGKNLLAIFIPRKSEEKNVFKLYYRLLNSRICYPAKTSMVVLLSKESKIQEQENLGKQYFDRIIENKDINKLSKLLNDEFNPNLQPTLQKIQKKLFQLQAKTQSYNLEYLSSIEFHESQIDIFSSELKKIKYHNNFKNTDEISRSSIFDYNDAIIGLKKLSKRTSDLIELRSFFEFSINSTFMFDDGIPYFHKLEHKILSLNKIPTCRNDPNKPIRIASLFGWYIGNFNSISDINTRINKL